MNHRSDDESPVVMIIQALDVAHAALAIAGGCRRRRCPDCRRLSHFLADQHDFWSTAMRAAA